MQYVNLGGSLADGEGYRLHEGNYWPGQPTIIRAPGWPLFLSVPFRLTPREARLRTSRFLAAALDSLNAVLMALLALALGAGGLTAAAAGLLYAVNPVMSGLCALSASEPLGIVFLLLSLLVVARKNDFTGWSWPLCGFLLGCSALVRMNWILVAFLLAPGLLWVGRSKPGSAVLRATAVCVVALGVVSPWVVRNSIVFGRTLVLGGGGGETLVGGNNDLAAEVGGEHWGYIVQPGGIPGEEPLHELAATMDESEVNSYYVGRALTWLRANPRKIPGLVLGKLFRAYVPWPRSRGLPVLVGTAYRWIVYVLAAWGVIVCIRRGTRIDGNSFAALLAVVLAHLAVTVVFCGVSRYIVASEILLCIPAAVIPSLLWRRVSQCSAIRHGSV